jgi:DNA-binding transcriptional MerR regulator
MSTDEQEITPPDEGAISYTIEQVAAKTGLTKRTLRYYEEVGLLPPTGRTDGNYRRYSEADVNILERIMNMRDLLGFTLAEIRKLLQAEDERAQMTAEFKHETAAAEKLTHLDRIDASLQEQLQHIEEKIAGLEQMRATLQAKLAKHEIRRQDLQKDIQS